MFSELITLHCIVIYLIWFFQPVYEFIKAVRTFDRKQVCNICSLDFILVHCLSLVEQVSAHVYLKVSLYAFKLEMINEPQLDHCLTRGFRRDYSDIIVLGGGNYWLQYVSGISTGPGLHSGWSFTSHDKAACI